jgi:Flp pilus assembly protein TadD
MAAVLVAAACASTPKAPRRPSATVRAEIEQAETAERARQHDVARAHYQRAVAAANDPASIAFARREFAETLITWGEVPEAMAQLEGVVAAAPDHAASWHDLGILRHNQGDDAGAATALERAKDLAREDPRPRIALAALRWQRGDRAGAQAEYRALLDLDLPTKVREKVKWALQELAKAPPPSPNGGTAVD